MEHKAFFLLLVLLSFRYLPHWLNLFRESNLRTYNTGDAKLTALQRKSESKCYLHHSQNDMQMTAKSCHPSL